MEAGISTACLYPLETEKSLTLLLQAGYRCFELFFNSDREFSPDFITAVGKQLHAAHARACSFHLFTSGFEPFLFFSDYPRRFEDGLELYRRYFASAARTGAGIAVFHGDRKDSTLSVEEYCERFSRLSRAAEEEGVILAQENVSRCRSAHAEEIRKMRGYLGSSIRFVLDLKQAIRAGESPFDMFAAMEGSIVNVHVSDSDGKHDCLLPGTGAMDFPRLKTLLLRSGYHGPLLTEVYRSNYKSVQELSASRTFMEAFAREDL